jgi:hypothetical protein
MPAPGVATGTSSTAGDYVTPTAYNVMQPFMNNKMMNRMDPGGTASAPQPDVTFARAAIAAAQTPNARFIENQSAIQAGGSATRYSEPRRVVARAGTARPGGGTGAIARAASLGATPGQVLSSGRASSAAPTTTAASNRRVIARGTARTNPNTPPVTVPGNPPPQLPMAQCNLGYTNCMNGYCARADAVYNKCFCSPRLAQIDAKYQPVIESMIEQIGVLSGGGHTLSDADLEQIWGEVFAGAPSNTLADLNASLDIDWSGTENSMRGQNAFAIGHDYCVQNLRGCQYAASNMRDAYRSAIWGDCDFYESHLMRIQAAAQLIIDELME